MSASVFIPAMAEGARRLCCSNSGHGSLRPTKKKTMGTVKFVTIYRNPSCGSGTKTSFRVRATDRRPEQPDYGAGEPQDGSVIQEDWKYHWKLGAVSLVAAAVIKYGSILLPEITRPNLIQALFMILIPVVVAVVLLIRASYAKNQK